jgi:hypothetical protein
MASAETTLLVFVVSLLIGGFAISIGARLALASKDYSHAVLTALFGAIAWAVVSAIFEEAGIGGAFSSLVGLLVWMWVIRRRFEVGWLRGGIIGLFAWLAALVTGGPDGRLGLSRRRRPDRGVRCPGQRPLPGCATPCRPAVGSVLRCSVRRR